MSTSEILSRLERQIRPLVNRLPMTVVTRVFSTGRTTFVNKLVKDRPKKRTIKHPGVDAWNLHFNLPIWNAAGMFKKGEGYEMVARQGAGAYVAGTTTSRPRTGNKRNGILWPSVPYAKSHAASNWLGLPNEGHRVVAHKLSGVEKIHGCPLGISVSTEPGLEESVALEELLTGLFLYYNAGVDYIEINESCPNVPGHKDGNLLSNDLIHRLEYISKHFLARRERPLPVVVKFSVDT